MTNENAAPQASQPTPPPQVYNPACLEAMKAFRKAKPWRGNIEERKEKFLMLHEALRSAYSLQVGLEFLEIEPLAGQGESRFAIADGKIFLVRKLSVVTYLVAFATARGIVGEHASIWAKTLYKRIFPNSAAKHREVEGFTVPRPE